MTQEPLPLDSLADEYQVLAELRSQDESRTFIGTRRGDGLPVLIRVVQSPKDDARNTLTHYAADTNLLATIQHKSLVPVLGGRWIDPKHFVIITERSKLPSLEELLSRGEELSCTRIAAILQEVSALTCWARDHGVVHRSITPATLYLEPGSDRVRTAFVVGPLPITGIPGPEADARTVASLAWAMLTRNSKGSEGAEVSLADARPDLPSRLVEQTEMLLQAKSTDEELPNVRDYVALIAMADALRHGEDETARVRTQLMQEQRTTREEIEAARTELERQRSEHEQRVTAEKADVQQTLEREREEMRRTLEREREEMQRTLAQEREQMEETLARSREDLAHQRSELAREIMERRKELASDRTKYERELGSAQDQVMADRAQLEGVRAEIESQLGVLAAQRAEIDQQREELARLRDSVRRARDSRRETRPTEDREVPMVAPMLADVPEGPAEVPAIAAGSGNVPADVSPEAVVAAPTIPAVVAPSTPLESNTTASTEIRDLARSRRKRRRVIAASALSLTAVVVASALAIGHYGSPSPVASNATPVARTSAPTVVANKPAASHVVVDSSAGRIAPAAATLTFPRVDSSYRNNDSARTVATATPPRRRTPRRVDTAAPAVDTSAFISPFDLTRPLRDLPRTNEGAPRDSAVRQRPVRPRPDSGSRDTTAKPKPDTLSGKPDSVSERKR
jgi:hypothetical protein